MGVADFWDKEYTDADSGPTRTPVSEQSKALGARFRKWRVESVLDLGCGVGRLAMFLGKSGFSVVGADISAVGITRARRWAREEGLEIGFCVADACKLPFKNRSFDAVVANSVLDHMSLDQAKEAEAEISRVISDTGVVFASFDHLEEEPEGTEYDTMPDGTRVYTAGPQTGMTWRFFSDEEIRSLFFGFEARAIETIESGSRHLWAGKQPGDLRSRKDR